MNRLNFSAVKPVIGRVLGVCQTDARIAQYTNEAQERLMLKDKWVGTTIRYRLCLSSSCVTLPRQIETIEAWALCDQPMQIRNRWYEFVQNGPGQRRQNLGSPNQLIDRGTSCLFHDMDNTTSLVNVVANVPEAAGAKILLRGYDENAQWIRTEYPGPGTWIDGEYVAINTTGTRSTKKFSSITEVVKPVTNGPVNLFEWVNGANFQQIAYYESDETLPIYRRYLIPGLEQAGNCQNTSTDCCENKSVTVIAKLRHIPVSNDNDFLILQNIGALKLMVMAILKEERNLFQEALGYEAQAVKLLQDELSSFEGDGVTPVLRLEHPDLFGGYVENDIESPVMYPNPI